MKTTLNVKVLAVGQVLLTQTVHKKSQKQILTVIEVPDQNPYGVDYEEKAIPFDIEIRNNNVETFNVSAAAISEHAEVEVYFAPYKKDTNTPTAFNIIVNKFSFIL